MHSLGAFLAPTFIGAVLAIAISNAGFAQSGNQPGLMPKATIVHKVQKASQRMEMTVATSRILTLDLKIPQAQVNDPNILDLVPLSPTEIQMSAKAPGITEVNLWDENKQVYTIDVIVYADSRELDMVLDQQFPDSSLTVKAIGTRVLISGYVDRPDDIEIILRIAEAYYPDEGAVMTNIQVGGVHQVLLHVKIMEVSRTKLRALGIDWTQISGGNYVDVFPGGTGSISQAVAFVMGSGGGSFKGVLEAMRNDSIAKILAEPTLTTVSGRAAYFQVGGDVGYVSKVTLDGTETISFRKYGTRLDFMPIVLGDGRIRLEVRPHVSELDLANSYRGIPAIKYSEVETGVEMKPGQTLALAGLLQTRIESERKGIPWVSEIPYLGTMFRRVQEKANEVELLIMVTPELVEPISAEDAPRLGPGMQTTSPSDWQLYVRGHIEVPVCCQSCGGAGCSQCAGQAADGGQLSAQPGMIGGSGHIRNGQTFPSDAVFISDSSTPTVPMQRDASASEGGIRTTPHDRSSQNSPPMPSPADSSSQLPGFMGAIGYDVED